MKILATTACIETWGSSNDEVVFLGEWCKRYTHKKEWKDKKYSVISYHWKDRFKLQKDYEYLFEFYEKLLSELCIQLNKIHGVKYTKRYWRIVIGPWLLIYLPVLWDRWESVNKACNKREKFITFVPDAVINREVANDYNSAVKLVTNNDNWNYLLFCSILKFKKQRNITLIKKFFKPIKNKDLKFDIGKKSAIYIVAKALDYLLSKLPSSYNSKFVLYKLQVPIFSLVMIFVRLFRCPRLFLEFEEKINYCKTSINYRNANEKVYLNGNFENFVRQQVFKDMPIAYLENYQTIAAKVKKSNFSQKAKIIMTASAHYYNEMFKFWAAGMVDNGSRLIISSHGGSMRSKFEVFDHEEKISDCKITWSKPFHDKHIQLSPNKVIKKGDYNGKGIYITLIDFEKYRYADRIQSTPMSSLILEDFKQKVDFIHLMKVSNLEEVKVRPYEGIQGWSTKERYIDIFGDKIISNCKTAGEVFKNSKIVVCAYPQTAFFESMQSGIPTILLYFEKYWEVEKTFLPLVEEMRNIGILHNNAESAVEHIKAIYSNPFKWWNDIETRRVRRMFDNICGAPSQDVSIDKEWSEFLMKIVNNPEIE